MELWCTRTKGQLNYNPKPNTKTFRCFPSIEYRFAELKGGQFFSKIYFKLAYQQIVVILKTQKLLSICKHKAYLCTVDYICSENNI